MAFTLTTPFQSLEEIKKSRFLVNVAPVHTPEQALDFIQNMSDSTASHNCWAWKIGQNYRFNDDGEPTSTAGKPILAAIEGQQINYTVAVVTRWFGGIKLGTGGLMRAYGGCVARCLQQAPLIEVISYINCYFHCYYSEWPILENRLISLSANIKDKSFDADGISITLDIPEQYFKDLQHVLSDLTKGRIQAKRVNK